ncbi:hypothetical protein BDR06DRAFT_445666 [Suillus hirtellus]|nr:hypothetical protein BDR06DRAFT_445666 [Suillus hirtellus]
MPQGRKRKYADELIWSRLCQICTCVALGALNLFTAKPTLIKRPANLRASARVSWASQQWQWFQDHPVHTSGGTAQRTMWSSYQPRDTSTYLCLYVRVTNSHRNYRNTPTSIAYKRPIDIATSLSPLKLGTSCV